MDSSRHFRQEDGHAPAAAPQQAPRPAHDVAVAGMFGRIVRFYDLLNRVLSLGLDQYWRKVLARNVRLGDTGVVLDLAAGTLDVSLAIRRQHPTALVPALDFCPPMLVQGSRKLKGENARRILPVAADAKRLPLPDASVDCLTIAFGIRNIIPREAAFAEMLRVLRPGGRACILEFGSGRERIWGGLYNLYLNFLLPRVGRLFSKDPAAYGYLADTIRAFPSAVELEKELRKAGFSKAWHQKLTSGIVCLHVGEKAR
ncbi:Demethylmenaquinone methyltransferase [uncultured Desulfovibrio sp.]|uniref:Demethylmenaquinone methyltransferase n=1 Tax=uncultured Desulfovibrio sp. TaxID=167968 RepID=A0A212L2J3_9BACT|nr:Demethylmenaquinone methyltransferase [uncultured Desulfovibrio sp.]VZH33087.1 Ubiquinone/menaquinone biosynthesis C-methyltransferase UbiE [Desulfovibrio sp. 86]